MENIAIVNPENARLSQEICKLASGSETPVTRGTFLPDLLFNKQNTGIRYVARQGYWRFVGPVMYVQGYIKISLKGSKTGKAIIANLPFPSIDDVILMPQIINVGCMAGMHMTPTCWAEITPGNSYLDLYTTNGQALTNTSFGDSSAIRFSGYYFAE